MITYAVSVVILLASSMSVVSAMAWLMPTWLLLLVFCRCWREWKEHYRQTDEVSDPSDALFLVSRGSLLGCAAAACARPECLCSRHYHFAHHLLHSDLALFLTRFGFGQPSCLFARLTEKLGVLRMWNVSLM